MTRFDAEPVLAGLKDFQRATVEHVIDRYFGERPTRRFLVADETGLGKSVVARGIIARTLERLQDDDRVERVDIVYICSNTDIASQNIARLKVTEGEYLPLSSRLTLLAKHSRVLEAATATAGKPVNLVAFTPGTSFSRGWRTGLAEERAMLYLLLEKELGLRSGGRKRALLALQGTVSTRDRFESVVESLRNELDGKPDPRIAATFAQDAQSSGQLQRFEALLEALKSPSVMPSTLRESATTLTGQLRTTLAKAGVEALEPDLVILDEFQRFRYLLSTDEGDESAELASQLFGYQDARVLLLSATPYKPFTLAQEAQSGEDHHEDFMRTLRFLCPDEEWLTATRSAFAEYRDATIRGDAAEGARAAVRELLLRVMCRSERPLLGQDGMLREMLRTAANVSAADIGAYGSLRALADEVEAPATLEYWKSAPYFVNFTDGYQLGERLRAALKNVDRAAELKPLIDRAQRLDVDAMSRYQPVDLGNARLRQLAADTVDVGWWRLLWVPPSLPYHQLTGPFAKAAARGMTKRLIFSSWSATPSALAGMLSYEAERRIVADRLRANTAEERRRVATRLDYRVDRERSGGRPAAMSTLALFWPHPTLAALTDPLELARTQPERVPATGEVERWAADVLGAWFPATLLSSGHSGEIHPWAAMFRWPGFAPTAGLDQAQAVAALAGRTDANSADAVDAGLEAHVELACDVQDASRWPVAVRPEQVLDELASLALHAPGNVAWRSLGRLLSNAPGVSAAGHWRAAAVLASGLRTLFNRHESTLLLGQLEPDVVYWRAVLRYSAAGCLQSVLDEYVHHLRSAMSDVALDDAALMSVATQARDALAIRASTYQAFDPCEPTSPIPLLSRFALRYGGPRDDAEAARHPEVRGAFNSPFWPFILATTSAGQEGIDFHWWCSAIVHWNIPANPVDFEQREGRVHRFGGHAIRRNIAERHRADALAADARDVWESAYDAARRSSAEPGDFSPYWIYPGSARIERHLLPYPLSRDLAKLERLKDDLALYRLAFGQPRQEDMLDLLRRKGVDRSATASGVDLRPPQRHD